MSETTGVFNAEQLDAINVIKDGLEASGLSVRYNQALARDADMFERLSKYNPRFLGPENKDIAISKRRAFMSGLPFAFRASPNEKGVSTIELYKIDQSSGLIMPYSDVRIGYSDQAKQDLVTCEGFKTDDIIFALMGLEFQAWNRLDYFSR